jgi:rRNA maturation RNase YbeY
MATPEAEIQIFNQTSQSLPLTISDCHSIAEAITQKENCTFSNIELVFVDEEEIIRINREHLDHDYVTDIITFPYHEPEDSDIEGTLFCCASRIAEQARQFGESTTREFRRIVIHGLLHLAGYHDKTDSQQKMMAEKEDFYLDQIS